MLDAIASALVLAYGPNLRVHNGRYSIAARAVCWVCNGPKHTRIVMRRPRPSPDCVCHRAGWIDVTETIECVLEYADVNQLDATPAVVELDANETLGELASGMRAAA
jgi:hypothetical protein